MTAPIRTSPASQHVADEFSHPWEPHRDGCEIRLLESAPGPEWDATVLQASPAAYLGMASHWFSIIKRTYGHHPLYLIGRNGFGPDVPLLSSFLLTRWPLRGIVTSMPFLDVGGPLGSPSMVGAAAARLLLEARNHNATRVEIRSLVQLGGAVQPSLEKVTLVRSLPKDPDFLWRELDSKVRNQIRKAERSGIAAEVGGLERLDDFYQVFAVNMRDLGSPVHSKRFFREIITEFGQAARVVVARKGALPVGGLVSIVFGDTLYVPWASTLRAYSVLCPNMLMYWETLRRACRDGMARFDFGRSSRGSGTYRFKRQWGANEIQLYWYSIPLNDNRPIRFSKKAKTWGLLSRIWRHLPVGLSLALGPRIRKYLSQ